jgi:hypothetical protein
MKIYLYYLYILLSIILIPLYLTILKFYYDSKIINLLLYSMIIFLSGMWMYTYNSLRKMKFVGLAGLILLFYLFGLSLLYLIYLLNILVRNDFKLKNYSKNEKIISLLILLILFLQVLNLFFNF